MSTKFTMEQAIEHQKRNGFGPVSLGAPQSNGGLARDIAKASIPQSKDESPLEALFLSLWTRAGGPPLERESGLIPGRMFRVDFVHRPSKRVIEIEGYGIGHFGKAGFKKDAEKYFALDIDLDYRITRLTKHLITEENVKKIIAVIEKACSISEK